jgi:hypothetical protein
VNHGLEISESENNTDKMVIALKSHLPIDFVGVRFEGINQKRRITN